MESLGFAVLLPIVCAISRVGQKLAQHRDAQSTGKGQISLQYINVILSVLSTLTFVVGALQALLSPKFVTRYLLCAVDCNRITVVNQISAKLLIFDPLPDQIQLNILNLTYFNYLQETSQRVMMRYNLEFRKEVFQVLPKHRATHFTSGLPGRRHLQDKGEYAIEKQYRELVLRFTWVSWVRNCCKPLQQ